MSYFYKQFIGFIFFITFAQPNFARSYQNDNANVPNSKVSKFFDYNENNLPINLVTGGYRPELHTLAKYMVSICRKKKNAKDYFGATHYCGGAILNPRVILTAAHCLTTGKENLPMEPSSIEVVASNPIRLLRTKDTQVFDVGKLLVHPLYERKYVINDIGLIILRDKIHLDGKLAAAIRLPESEFAPYSLCTVVGWGKMYQEGPMSNEILYANMTVLSLDICQIFRPSLTKEKLCAIDIYDIQKDACQGDSGGPLICNETLTGIISHGYGCAAGIPGFYTNVYWYTDWISECIDNPLSYSCSDNCHCLWLIYFLLFWSYIYGHTIFCWGIMI